MSREDVLDKGIINGVDKRRRTFLKWLLGGLFASAVGAIVYPLARYLVPPETMKSISSVRIGKPSEIPPGTSILFKLGSYPALFVNYQGEYYCYGAICTHLGCIAHYEDKKGCAMNMKEGKEIHCVCHAGHYDIKTGEVLAGPPPKALPKVSIRMINDEIYADGWENPAYVKTLANY